MVKRGMRRKNRQVKMTLDIPDDYADEEEFMEALMAKMDNEPAWQMQLSEEEDDEGDITVVIVHISKMNLGDIDIEPEGDEDEEGA